MFTHLKHLRLSLCLMLIGTSFLLLPGCSTPPPMKMLIQQIG